MDQFTARPHHIIGNIALASLIAGAPVGAVFAALGGNMQPGAHTPWEWMHGVGSGALQGICFDFVAGILIIAPALAVLRRFGYGGPIFVYAISVVLGLTALADNLRFGLVVLAFAVTASTVFCARAYTD